MFHAEVVDLDDKRDAACGEAVSEVEHCGEESLSTVYGEEKPTALKVKEVSSKKRTLSPLMI